MTQICNVCGAKYQEKQNDNNTTHCYDCILIKNFKTENYKYEYD